MTSGREPGQPGNGATAAQRAAPGPTPDNWRLYAACRGHDPEMWTLAEGGRSWRYWRAHAICDTCPVTRQCRDFAEDTGSWGVIFGGVDYRRPPDRRDPRVRERRDHIDRAIAAGMTVAAIAQQFGLTARQILRHRARHRAASLRRAP